MPGASALGPLLDAASSSYEIGPTPPQTPALVHFTSGTTGRPKAAVHVHEAVVAHHATARNALDLRAGDTFWCTADPGWVTGTSYGIVAPLTHRTTSVVDGGDLDPARWYAILADERIDVWYTTPTAIRMLARAGPQVVGIDRPRPQLRLAATVGEPLTPDLVRWAAEVLGIELHDTWWQTETGAIMIAAPRCEPVRPGSMGTALPGVDATVLSCDDDGTLTRDASGSVRGAGPEEVGMLAVRRGWPSMFRAYLDDVPGWRAAFAGDWYLSGDLARRDADGWYWFVSRADDVIKTAGHLVGPPEIERVLLDHPGVADVAVYGVPDAVAGAVVHATVVLRPGVPADERTRRELLAHGRRALGAAVAPRRIAFASDLPTTTSGKVLRRLVRARELGLDEVDVGGRSMPATGRPGGATMGDVSDVAHALLAAGGRGEWHDAVAACELPLVVWEQATTRIELANRPAEELIGLPAGGLVGRHVADLVDPPEEFELSTAALRAGAADLIRGRRHLRRDDGGTVPVTVWTRTIDVDGRAASVTLVVPGDEQDQLDAGAGRWRDVGPIAVGATDDRWRIVSLSSDAAAILGGEPAAWLGVSMLELVHPDDRARLSATGTGSTALDVRVRRVDGTWAEVCVLTAAARSGAASTRSFALVGLSPARTARGRVAELERRLRRIAAEVRAAGVLDVVDPAGSAGAGPELTGLTARQWEVLSRLVQGQRVTSIARDLYVSPSTVRNHLTAIFARFGVHSQAELLDRLRTRPVDDERSA